MERVEAGHGSCGGNPPKQKHICLLLLRWALPCHAPPAPHRPPTLPSSFLSEPRSFRSEVSSQRCRRRGSHCAGLTQQNISLGQMKSTAVHPLCVFVVISDVQFIFLNFIVQAEWRSQDNQDHSFHHTLDRKRSVFSQGRRQLCRLKGCFVILFGFPGHKGK